MTNYEGMPEELYWTCLWLSGKILVESDVEISDLAEKWKAYYQEYLQSDFWKQKSDKAKERAGYKCQVCNSPDNLQTHHRTYTRLGFEKDEDLTVLCDGCHSLFHAKLD